jgi:hypothetical protein
MTVALFSFCAVTSLSVMSTMTLGSMPVRSVGRTRARVIAVSVPVGMRMRMRLAVAMAAAVVPAI